MLSVLKLSLWLAASAVRLPVLWEWTRSSELAVRIKQALRPLDSILISHFGTISFPDIRAHCFIVAMPREIPSLSVPMALFPVLQNAEHSLSVHTHILMVCQNHTI